MLKPEEVPQHLLSLQYILEHGVSGDELADESYTDENGFYHYERKFDKPLNEGGKPFSGLAYDFYYNSNMLSGYTEYRDGYTYGDDVWYYPSGALSRYSRYCENEHYIYLWHENGILKEVIQNHRNDNPQYRRFKKYDDNGKLTEQTIYCELRFTYDFNSPNLSYEVTWHKNGEFKLIRNNAPTRETFYSQIEFDENGYPIKYSVNPHYSPEYLSPERYADFFHIKTFDKGYSFAGDTLMKSTEYGRIKYSGQLCFRHNDGYIEKIMEFKKGIPYTAQYMYYENGNLKEEYCISKGKLYHRHIYWYESGSIKQVVLYSYDMKRKHCICFDKNGNVTHESEEIM